MSKKDKYTFSSKGFSMSNENTSSSSAVVSSSILNTSSTTVVPSIAVSSKVTPVKKATVPPSVKATVKTVKPTNPSNVDKLLNLIQKYEEALKEKKETITLWINLCNYLNRTNDPKVFQTFYVWFTKHLKDYTSAEIALAGVHTIQNANTKVRVGSTHQCFEELARVLASKNSHFRFTMKAMQAMAISESLARWFFAKTNR